MLLALIGVGFIVNAIAGDNAIANTHSGQVDDGACLLQARVNITHRPFVQKWRDATECMAWAEKKDGDTPLACYSNLLRATFLVVLYSDSGDEMKEAGKKYVTKPKLCGDLDIRNCELHVIANDKFATLRGLPMPGSDLEVTRDLIASFEEGPLVSLTGKSGGKSGAEFMKTANGRFVIKGGLLEGKRMDEVSNIETLLDGNPSLAAHFTDHPTSTLNRIYGVIHAEIGNSITSSDSVVFAILEDATHRQNLVMESKGDDVGYITYDLKSRPGVDQSMFIHSQESRTHGNGHMVVTPAQCDRLIETVRADGAFLHAHDMIDFSLFVGVATSDLDEVPDCPANLKAPLCLTGRVPQTGSLVQYTVSIIDYLNNLNWFKTIENARPDKFGKFDDWDEKIADLTSKICIGTR